MHILFHLVVKIFIGVSSANITNLSQRNKLISIYVEKMAQMPQRGLPVYWRRHSVSAKKRMDYFVLPSTFRIFVGQKLTYYAKDFLFTPFCIKRLGIVCLPAAPVGGSGRRGLQRRTCADFRD
jgi:hypothetical protein